MLKKLYYIIIFSLILTNLQADIFCTHCKNKIQGRYLLSSTKKPYCSKECFSSLLPKCSVCKRAVQGKYRNANNKVFCSDRCFSTILPKCNLCVQPVTKAFKIDDKPFCVNCMKFDKCFSCRQPAKKHANYKDGRKYCLECKDDVVFDEANARKIYEKAVKLHAQFMGKAGLKIPPMKFVDMKTLNAQTHHKGEGGMSLRGYYQETKKETQVTDSNNRIVSRTEEKTAEMIYLLNGLTDEEILVTAIHELTHDWLSDFYPGMKVAPLWVEEGFCQYVAYNFCLDNKYDKLALKIKNAPDQVYGKGAKFFIEKFGRNNLLGAYKWMLTQKYQVKPPIGTKRRD